MINLHERMLPTSAGVEPATSWSPVGRRIQLSHRSRLVRSAKTHENLTWDWNKGRARVVGCLSSWTQRWAVTLEPVKGKGPSNMTKMRRFISSCACVKYYSVVCSLFIHSVVSNDSVSGQWRPDQPGNLDLRYPHKAKDTVSLGAAKPGWCLNSWKSIMNKEAYLQA